MPKYLLKDLRGINASQAALQLPPGDVPFMQNVRPRPFSNWSKRKGIEPVAVYEDPIMGMFQLELDNIVMPIFQSGGALTFFPTITSDSLPYTPDPYALGDGRSSLDLDPSGVNALVKGRSGGASSACVYTCGASPVSVDSSAQNVTITVTTFIGCAWNASPVSSWLTNVTGSAHLSGGSYTFHVDANTGVARTGTITIYRGSTGSASVGLTITVNQDAGGPSTYLVSGGPITQMKVFGVCQATPASAAPVVWDGIVSDALNPGTIWAAPLTINSWLGFLLAGMTITKDGGGAGVWRLVGSAGGGTGTFRYDKVGGADPTGVYAVTAFGCAPATLTVS